MEDTLTAAVAQLQAAAAAETATPQFKALAAAFSAMNAKLGAINAIAPGSNGRPDHEACCGNCKDGKQCVTALANKFCGTSTPPVGFEPFMQIYSSISDCALSCRDIDPCLNHYLCEMTTRVDLWSMANYMRLDDDIVSINTSAGAPAFVDFPNVPLAAGQSTLLRSNSTQRLPWRPGCIRVVAEWNPNGQPRPSSLEITWFAADRDLAGITPEQLSDQGRFTQVGVSKKLSSYISNDDCCLFPFPSFMRCDPPVVPDTRAIYARLTLGNVGGNDQLVGLNLEVIKGGTSEGDRCLSKCGGKC